MKNFLNHVTLEELNWFSRAIRAGSKWRAAKNVADRFGFKMK